MNDQEALSKAILALRAQARTYWGDNLTGHYAADCEDAARQLFALQKWLSQQDQAAQQRQQDALTPLGTFVVPHAKKQLETAFAPRKHAFDLQQRLAALERLEQAVREEHYRCLDHRQKMPCAICQAIDALPDAQGEEVEG